MITVNNIVICQYDNEGGMVTMKALKELSGLSTDSKPTDSDLMPNSLFLELDTGDTYYYTGTTWAKVGA